MIRRNENENSKKKLKNEILFYGFIFLLLLFIFSGCVTHRDENKREDSISIQLRINFEELEKALSNFDHIDHCIFNHSDCEIDGMFLDVSTVFELADFPQIIDFYVRNLLLLSSFDLEYYSENIRSHRGHPQGFFLYSTLGTEIPQFQSGLITLSEGEIFDSTGIYSEDQLIPIILSSELASTNNLSVGDDITLEYFVRFPVQSILDGYRIIETENPYFYDEELIFQKLSFGFNIVGLFEESTDPNVSFTDTSLDGNNAFFIPHWGFERINDTITRAEFQVWDYVDYEIPIDIIEHLILSRKILSVEFIVEDEVSLQDFFHEIEMQSLLPNDLYKFSSNLIGE